MSVEPEFQTVPLTALLSMPFKMREHPEEDLEELVENIRQVGVLEPIVVRPRDSGFLEIVAGERRYEAAKKIDRTSTDPGEKPNAPKTSASLDACAKTLSIPMLS